ncbi:MAG: universal stress protein [Thermodesulfobacteriota bacterium]
MYQKILVPLDGSQLAECVLPHVEAFIQGCQVQTVIFARVVEPASTRFWGAPTATSQVDYSQILEYTKRMEDERKSYAADYLQSVAGRLMRSGVKFQHEVLVGSVADCLVDFAEARDVDLILIATHGRSGVSRWVRGSVADRILRASSVPVLMVRAPGTMGESRG